MVDPGEGPDGVAPPGRGDWSRSDAILPIIGNDVSSVNWCVARGPHRLRVAIRAGIAIPQQLHQVAVEDP